MTNESEVGVVVGRFQVPDLHSAHVDFIKEVESRHSRLLIFIGVHPFPSSRDNPLDFPTRAAMLRSYFPNAIIMPIYDHASDAVWSDSLDSMVRGVYPFHRAVLYGGRDSFIRHYEGKFQTCELYGSEAKSGTDEREAVRRSTLTTALERRGAIYACSNRYAEVKPTVDIALVKKENKDFFICVGRKPGESAWRLPGGFVEAKHGSLEDTVIQELFEETGILTTKGSIYYIGSFKVNDWRASDTETIMTSLFAVRYTDGAIRPGDDISEVKWVRFADLYHLEQFAPHQELFERVSDRAVLATGL